MKKLIRRSCWETNSSSSHSLSIADNDKEFVFETIYPNQNGVITLTGGEFGWEWFKHNDSITKANYAAQSLGALDVLIDVIKEQTGATDVIIDVENGYIDHDSYGIVPRSKEELRNFIFNKNSWLFGGNDNQTPDPTFYVVPEYRDNKIFEPVFKYELFIEGLDKTTKFQNKPTERELADAIETLVDGRLMDGSGKFLSLDITENIMFKIMLREEEYYKKDWFVQQDYSTGYLLLTKENSVRKIEETLKEMKKFEKLGWDQKSNLIRKEVLKKPDTHIKLKITLKEI